MGLVLMAGLFAGCALGLVLAAILGGAGIWLMVRNAKARTRAWWCFAAVFLILLLVGIAAVHQYPYAPVRPGSDYDVAMRNLFLQGFGYCASPGPAALLAALAARLMPRKSANKMPGSN
jgi:hypothetical protein